MAHAESSRLSPTVLLQVGRASRFASSLIAVTTTGESTLALPSPFWRRVAHARKVKCPMLIQAGQRDISVSAKAIDQLAHRAPRVVVKRYDVDHFQPFYGDHPALIITDQADWLTATIPVLAQRKK